MATVTKTIGTASRDYSTITLWEADLDNFSTVYANGDDAVGECYNDSDFNEVVNIDGGGTSITGLNSIKLTVAEADRHDGTAGTGARMVYDSKIQMYSDKNIEVCWLEIDWGGTSSGGNQFSIVYTHNNSYQQKIANMLVHDAQTASTGRMIQGKYGYLTVANNIIYNLTHTSAYRAYGIYVDSYRPSYAYNNTVHNIQSTHPNAAYTFGIHIAYSNNVRNNIVTEVGSAVYSGCFGNVAAGTNSNNMSTDNTAPGPNSLTEVTASAQFVSVVAGAEDLHLATGSEARGAGANLGSAGDIVQSDIDGVYRGSVWDIGADQTPATVTKTIGSAGRDYSTIGLWEADLDTQGVYANGDSVVGECYNDSTFTGGANINGGTTVGLSSVTLSVAEGERHDGTLNTGVKIKPAYIIAGRLINISRDNLTVEWLECEVNGASTYAHTPAIAFNIYNSNNSARYLVLKGENKVYPAQTPYLAVVGGNNNILHNNIVYGTANGNNGGGIADSYRACSAFNNTIYDCNYGYKAASADQNQRTIKNNLSIGNNVDFYPSTVTVGSSSNNASSDSTATAFGGSDHVTGAVTEDQFISIVAGAEDLHLSGSSDAIDAGADLTGTVDGVEYDIDGQLRAGLWDIGADELLGGHIRRLLLGIG
jgi:hypothetical protein